MKTINRPIRSERTIAYREKVISEAFFALFLAQQIMHVVDSESVWENLERFWVM